MARLSERSVASAALVGACLLVAGACSGQAAPERDQLPGITTTSAAPTTTTTIIVSEADNGRLAAVAGRILILRADSSIVSMRPDGTDPVVMAAVSESVAARSQPTWSPDGDRIAWTEQMADDTFQLVIATAAGVEVSRVEAPMLAQYLDWAPAGDAIAFMGNDPLGAMTLAYAPNGENAVIIDRGAPMYIDWNPAGDALLVHIEDRLERLMPGNERRVTIPTDGEFRVGTHNGDRILYSIDGGEVGEVLVAADPDGDNRSSLLRFTAPTAVVVHQPTGRIAVMSTWTAEAVRFSEAPPTDLPALIPEQLSVLDPGTGDLTLVHSGRAVSWSWSPDGTLLLYSTLEFIEDSQRIVWHTWDGTDSVEYDNFTPTSRFGNSYLAFFDQHERSTTRWSPDSAAFVYAGGLSGGPAGIWVQPLDGGQPILVASGINATWSP